MDCRVTKQDLNCAASQNQRNTPTPVSKSEKSKVVGVTKSLCHRPAVTLGNNHRKRYCSCLHSRSQSLFTLPTTSRVGWLGRMPMSLPSTLRFRNDLFFNITASARDGMIAYSDYNYLIPLECTEQGIRAWGVSVGWEE